MVVAFVLLKWQGPHANKFKRRTTNAIYGWGPGLALKSFCIRIAEFLGYPRFSLYKGHEIQIVDALAGGGHGRELRYVSGVWVRSRVLGNVREQCPFLNTRGQEATAK